MVELSITNIAGEPFDIFMLNFYVDFEIFFVMSFPTTQMANFVSDGFFIMGNFNMGFQALFKETLFTKLALKLHFFFSNCYIKVPDFFSHTCLYKPWINVTKPKLKVWIIAPFVRINLVYRVSLPCLAAWEKSQRSHLKGLLVSCLYVICWRRCL